MGRPHIYWGDIHNHNEIGYGAGSLERSYALAEDALDFYAFTPHGWWPDVPADDPDVRRQHQEGFERVSEAWPRVVEAARERNRPGSFVTLLGWEWHSLRWGDYCLYFPGDESEFLRADDLDQLKAVARAHGALMIPHHPAYRLGWRGLDWASMDEGLSPVVEVFSEHGCSVEADTHLGMYGHSMGGADRGQTALAQLQAGRRFGFIASSDDHFGYPGGHGHGLTAVYADGLSSGEIFGALQRRRTYAVTGDRIRLRFRVAGGLPGDVVSAPDGAGIDVSVQGRDRLRAVEILKNATPWRVFTRPEMAPPSDGGEHMTRLEWGWDRLGSNAVTTWRIALTCERGVLEDPIGGFCGGAGSVTEVNRLSRIDERRLEIRSYTSRSNALPVSSLSVIWRGGMDARLLLEAEGAADGTPFRRTVSLAKRDLLGRDAFLSAIDRFSSPKLRVSALLRPEDYRFGSSVHDSEARAGDFYILKVTQENGQMAWSSPIWIAKE